MVTVDYLGKYAPVTMFQEGGAMPAGTPPEAGSAPEQGGAPDAMAQLQQMVAQYAQTRDPQLAVAIADALVAAMGVQGGAPQGAPAPAMNNGGSMSAPMFKKGGVLA